MKKHKKTAIAILLSIISLSSCSTQEDQSAQQSLNQSETSDQSARIIEYYQSEINRLESSILDLKEDYYIAQKQYEAEIHTLNQKLQDKNDAVQSQPEMEDISHLPFSYILNGDDATIVKYMGSAANITIPSELQGHKVTKIGEYAFNSDIESIIISEGIKEIDWFAFAGCTRLYEIYIPLSVTMINYGAFDYCPQNLVIKCKKGSYAEAYAKSYSLNCIAE